MNKSESINELATALSKAQGMINGVKKTNENPFYHSRYADLASCWDAIREPLSLNGLSVIQTTEANHELCIVETTLLHSSGQWASGVISMKPVKGDPQGMGSAMTYARRYGLMAITGIAPEDDDGNTASATEAKTKALTVTELRDKMDTASNAHELQNRWTKYAPDYELLSPEDKVVVRMAKDRRKSELTEAKK